MNAGLSPDSGALNVIERAGMTLDPRVKGLTERRPGAAGLMKCTTRFTQ
jgi:hypothetical protein